MVFKEFSSVPITLVLGWSALWNALWRRSHDPSDVVKDPYCALWGPHPEKHQAAQEVTLGATEPSPPKDEVFLIQPDIFMTGQDSVLYLLQRTASTPAIPSTVVLNLAGLQRIALQDLQQQIAVHVGVLKNQGAVHVKKEEKCHLIDLLHKYSTYHPLSRAANGTSLTSLASYRSQGP